MDLASWLETRKAAKRLTASEEESLRREEASAQTLQQLTFAASDGDTDSDDGGSSESAGSAGKAQDAASGAATVSKVWKVRFKKALDSKAPFDLDADSSDEGGQIAALDSEGAPNWSALLASLDALRPAHAVSQTVVEMASPDGKLFKARAR
jgi:hypothetical protein